MADVTGGTPPTNASPFAVPADIKAVYDHFGAPGKFSVATAASLPPTGNWAGRTLMTADTLTIWAWTGTGWEVVTTVDAPIQKLSGKSMSDVSVTATTYTFISQTTYFDIDTTIGSFPTPATNYLFKVGLVGRYRVELNAFFGGASAGTIHALKANSVAADSTTGAVARWSTQMVSNTGGISFTRELDLAANGQVSLANWFSIGGGLFSTIDKWSATIQYLGPIRT